MKYDTEKHPIKVIAIDLAKNSFQVFAADQSGRKVMNRNMNRQSLKEWMVKQQPCLVAMEACGSAHYWGRLFQTYGHKVKLIAPQFVKPYVKSNKSDVADAEAISEAVQRPGMRFVAIKEVAQQDIQAIHRLRSLAVGQRTAQVNQIRGLLQEYGLVLARGRATVINRLPEVLEDADNGLSDLFREQLQRMYEELLHSDQRVTDYDDTLQRLAKQDEQAKRLMTIPGVGPLVATALLAGIGDVKSFRNGRELAAWLGLVPRQHSTGGKPTLLGISKRGDVYLRTLLIHGARSVVLHVDQCRTNTQRWCQALKQRRHMNVAIVAMANKIARVAYALLKNGEDYSTATLARV